MRHNVCGMSPLSDTFRRLKAKGERALVTFMTAGDPTLGDLPDILHTLIEGGADVIEVGIPFSDPIADGPVIQASSHRALQRGATPLAILEVLSQVACRVPIVLMGYVNPMLRIELGRFAMRAAEAGASGVIVSDLTPEESGPWLDAARAHSLDTIFLAAPTSTDARLDAVCRASSGFVYAVSRTGVTGSETAASEEARDLCARLRARTELPICVGFGISEPSQVAEVSEYADGVIVGSALVDLLARRWEGGKGAAEIRSRVSLLKAATR
jgi:tryptophan synthase alpha chain